MIRIPFVDQAGAGRASGVPEGPRSVVEAERTEARLRKMEETLACHAEEIHSGVMERIDRIESRVRRAVCLLAADAEEERQENVVEFGGGGGAAHHGLPAMAAREALFELNATLKVTREHLEALGTSVRRLRGAAARGR